MKTDKLYFGAAYYDEYMPVSRVDEDMRMMKEAGMNVIRIAESTWSTWEPPPASSSRKPSSTRAFPPQGRSWPWWAPAIPPTTALPPPCAKVLPT